MSPILKGHDGHDPFLPNLCNFSEISGHTPTHALLIPLCITLIQLHRGDFIINLYYKSLLLSLKTVKIFTRKLIPGKRKKKENENE